MAVRDIVVIGASAGGVESLSALVQELPADLPAAVFVVLHLAATSRSQLPEILARKCRLPVERAIDQTRFLRGHVYVGPPGVHLVLHEARIRLSRGPRENGHRPAVDPLFRSAARWYGPRVTAVILSGALDDGCSGALAVKRRGGKVFAQSPDEALFPSMPLSVIERVGVDTVGTLRELAAAIVASVAQVVPDVAPSPPAMKEAKLEDIDMVADPEIPPDSPASSFTCPECHGALWELSEGPSVRFRCRVGHAFAPDSLVSYQEGHIEEAMWTAYRALHESAALSSRLATRARDAGLVESAARHEQRARDADTRAALLRRALEAKATGEH